MKRLSKLELTLTSPLRSYISRNFTPKQIRITSFILSLLTCLVDASVVTFSIFTPDFISKLNYSHVSINIISGMMSLGLYLTLPILGYLSDAHGPVLLALIGLLLTPGYLLALYTYKHKLSSFLMAFAFTLVGTGTSSAYFCSLLTCARVFPDRKGLSISLPVTCYGLSSLLLAWIFQMKTFKNSLDKVSIEKIFIGLAILYFIVGIINWASSIVVSLEKEVVFAQLLEQERSEGNYGAANDNSEDEVLLDGGIINEISHEEKFEKFLKDPTMKLILISLFFLAGPLELFIANMGSLIEIIENKGDIENEISKQVGVFSLFSTITRISIGVITDKYEGCKTTVRMLLFSILISAVGFTLVLISYPDFSLVSALIGIGYGSAFTLYPTLAATVWGVDILGSTWGLFLSAPAVGSLLFGLFYAYEYDGRCRAHTGIRAIQSGLYTSNCVSYTFALFVACFVASAIAVFGSWRRWDRVGCQVGLNNR